MPNTPALTVEELRIGYVEAPICDPISLFTIEGVGVG